MNVPKHYLLPNITSAANVGDEAMLEVVMGLIREEHEDAAITIHGFEPETHADLDVHANRPSLYYWAVFEDERAIVRAARLVLMVLGCLAVWLSVTPLLQLLKWISPALTSILDDYQKADVIVFVGGGYLRSKKGVSQSLNFLLHLVPFALSTTTAAKTVVAPISVGPFGYQWQARLTAWVFKKLDVVTVRERFSHKVLAEAGLEGHVLATDHALLMTPLKVHSGPGSKQSRPPVIGFTIRNWLDADTQSQLERSYALALAAVSKETGATIQPIIQVSAPRFGEDDGAATARVVKLLHSMSVKVEETVQIQGVSHGKAVYGKLTALVGMRMHSNIFAGTQFVPFVPISYEYKTEGISEDFELDAYCIRSEDVTAEKLTTNLSAVFTNSQTLSKNIARTLARIQKREHARWQKVFRS